MIKVGKDVAGEEFARLCAYHRIDIDEANMEGEEEIADFRKLRAAVVKAIMTGSLVVSAEGLATLHPVTEGAKPLTFYRPTAATFMAMDDGKGKIGQMVSALTDMTQSAKGSIAKLEAPDFHICSKLANLFLAQG